MPLTIHVPTPDTPRKILKSCDGGGKPTGRIAGGWVADLTGTKKSITLCPFCVSKFSPRSHAYELWRREWLVVARCDGCNEYSRQCKMFIHESFHDDVGESRRRGRWVS